jgi:Sulfotransferase family
MAVHFIHVSKAGGSVLRYAIREARKKNGGKLESQWGPIWAHNHLFCLSDLEADDMAVFPLRDPVTRFLSGFYSRLREGAPRYHIRHTRAEHQAFEWFPTPQELADALAARGQKRWRARFAMQSVGHLKRHQTFWTGKPSYLRKNLGQILYIARQETLSEDWEKIKALLDIPTDVALSKDETIAHRTEYVGDRTLSEKGTEAVRAWYAHDYKLLEIADEVRAGTAQAAPSSRLRRLTSLRGPSDKRRSAAAG